MLKPTLKKIVQPLKKPVDNYYEKRFNQRIRECTGMIPISETKPEDVFIVGYPKSGNTWIQNMVAGLLYGLSPDVSPDSLVQNLVPDIYMQPWYKRFSETVVFKSHELPKPQYRRVIYLLRDGRDATVSYFHYLNAVEPKPISMKELVERPPWPGSWQDHVSGWLANPYKADMITMRYEDLKKDTVGELRRFCKFYGVERGDAELRNIAERASFEKMRDREQKQGWSFKHWPKEKSFVRRGKVGSFKDEMPADVLETFMSKAGDTLKECRYI